MQTVSGIDLSKENIEIIKKEKEKTAVKNLSDRQLLNYVNDLYKRQEALQGKYDNISNKIHSAQASFKTAAPAQRAYSILEPKKFEFKTAMIIWGSIFGVYVVLGWVFGWGFFARLFSFYLGIPLLQSTLYSLAISLATVMTIPTIWVFIVRPIINKMRLKKWYKNKSAHDEKEYRDTQIRLASDEWKQKLINHKEFLRVKNSDLANIEAIINRYQKLIDDSAVPSKYNDPDIIETLCEYFDDRRADTLKEAVNLFVREEREAERDYAKNRHREEMKRRQDEHNKRMEQAAKDLEIQLRVSDAFASARQRELIDKQNKLIKEIEKINED